MLVVTLTVSIKSALPMFLVVNFCECICGGQDPLVFSRYTPNKTSSQHLSHRDDCVRESSQQSKSVVQDYTICLVSVSYRCSSCSVRPQTCHPGPKMKQRVIF